MKNSVTFIIIFLLAGISVFAQVGINADNSPADPSAGLDVKFTDKGFLIPRMTRVKRSAISSPAEGLMVYCTDCGANGSLSIYTNGSWNTFSNCTVDAPSAGAHAMSEGQIIWNWLAVQGAAGYRWNTANDYESAVDMGPGLSKTETGTCCNATYTRYVWAYSVCGESASTTLTQTVPVVAPVTPVTGTPTAALTSVVWNWNTVAGAAGYKWNTTNDYGTAVDMATLTTKSETGLTCGAPYTRYAWAYNGCGYSSPVELSQSTLSCVALSTVTTTVASAIAQTTASGGGNVTADGGGTVTGRGICWSTSANPTTSNSKTSDGSGTGSYTSSLTGLTPNTLYHIRAYATNNAGTAYGNDVTFTTLAFTIGQSYGGGKIFYIDGTGHSGLISAITDLGWVPWGCLGTLIGSTSTAVGTGQTSTTAIVNGCSTPGIAARVCDDLVLSGYDDWFLPAKDELNLMYQQRVAIGGFSALYYWSSSEYDANFTWYQHFGSGVQFNIDYQKGQSFPVRPVRAFPAVPNVTTTVPSNITQTTVTTGGNVTSDGGNAVTAQGVCWSTSPNPTTSNSLTIDGSGSGSFTSNLTGLTANTLYYVRAYATNSVGTGYGDEVSFTTLSFAVGQSYCGGTIFYVDVAGLSGLISSTSDQSAGVQWGCYGTSFPGTSADIGTGQANTTVIVNGCSTSDIAARICNDLSLNGFDDWFLPSKDELNQMYLQKTAIGGFANNRYWSSSDYVGQPTLAWFQDFTNGTQSGIYKNTSDHVRAVRAFPGVVLPTVTTTSVSNIAIITATSGGTVSSNGGDPITAKGVCWGTSSNPTTANANTTNGAGTGSFTSSLTGLLPNTLYYVRAFATNSAGTVYGNQVSFTALNYTVGLSYGGGVIFYLDGTGQHGLISATSDQSAGVFWGCQGTNIGTSTSFGTGQSNTTAIINGCGTAGIAARICDDLVLGIYTDWYLPSQDELVLMSQHKAEIGGLGAGYYWSSSQYDATNGRMVQIGVSAPNYTYKNTNYPVRAIRAF